MSGWVVSVVFVVVVVVVVVVMVLVVGTPTITLKVFCKRRIVLLKEF